MTVKNPKKLVKKIETIRESDIQAVLGETIKKIRKSAGVSQTDLGQLLDIHQTAVCRVENGTQSLLPYQLQRASEYFGVNVDSMLMGRVNYWKIAERFKRLPEVPERYRNFHFSRVREVFPLLQFLNEEEGHSYTQKALARFDLESLLFVNPDQSISTHCQLDLMRHAITDGALTEKNFAALIKQTRSEDFNGVMHPVYETQESSVKLIQTLLLNMHHYESNFEYQIEEVQRTGLVVSINPREHMREVEYRDEILGDCLCRYKKGLISEFPHYIGAKSFNLTEKECHYHGAAERCVYKIQVAA